MADRAVHLRHQPGLAPCIEDFELRLAPLPPLNEGDVCVRNTWLSVDPFMMLAISGTGRLPPVPIGGVVAPGGAVGVVEDSRHPDWHVGDVVVHPSVGWRESYVAAGSHLRATLPDAQPSWHLSALGLTGLTAYAGIEAVIRPGVGDTVFVSAAAGAVGSLAVQLAKERGARVIGCASSQAKLDWLCDLGVDHVFNYRKTNAYNALRDLSPNGLDAYFDNVGGEMLEAALSALRVGGVVGVCGAISRYGDPAYRGGPANFALITEKALVVAGVSAPAMLPRQQEITAHMLARLQSGQLTQAETIMEGLESTPSAFVAMMEGRNVGKMLVRLR